MEIITKSPTETFELGKKVGSSLKGGKILALSGQLGSGKTTFIQGLAKGLGVEQRIISPTFILMRQYPSTTLRTFYHLDLYRLEDNVDEELKNLGIDDIWEGAKNVVVIEWAEKAKYLPNNTQWIFFENEGYDKRKIIIK